MGTQQREKCKVNMWLEGILLGIITILVVLIVREIISPPKAPKIVPPPPKPEPVEPVNLNRTQLAEYRTGDKIYVAVDGDIYHVSTNFYGPGGPYHCFAGNDATYALATDSLAPESMNKDYSSLSAAQRDRLQEWKDVYRKY